MRSEEKSTTTVFGAESVQSEDSSQMMTTCLESLNALHIRDDKGLPTVQIVISLRLTRAWASVRQSSMNQSFLFLLHLRNRIWLRSERPDPKVVLVP